MIDKQVSAEGINPPVSDFLPGPSEGFDYSIQMAVKAIVEAIPVPPHFRILFSVKLPKISSVAQAVLNVSWGEFSSFYKG